MEFQNPQMLYLILPLALAWIGLSLYSKSRRTRARESFVASAMQERILPSESLIRFWTKQLLRLVAIVFALIALAGPKYGIEFEKIIPRGSDLYVMIDVSRSMLAEDVPPSRLERSKIDVSSLVNQLEGERIGLIAFAGQAVVKCPLTTDYDSFRRALAELDPSSAPRGGTAIGDAIRKALEVFQSKSGRDQAILLITDGDDQQSYPLEAAAIAAEQKVTIFAVGLGDSSQGARIPQGSGEKGFIEYQGEQVWSKLDGSLLSEIATKTSGVYIPAGTRSYDLGDLYTNHLRNRRAADAETQEKARKSEQYQLFLAFAVLALVLDLMIAPYPAVRQSMSDVRVSKSSVRRGIQATMIFLAMSLGLMNRSYSEEPHASVREGLKLFADKKYDVARDKFTSAVEALEKKKSEAAAIASFDEACAYHRQGELEKAKESYLRSGLSTNRSIAVSSHFNLGNLASEQAKALAGKEPESIEPDKRKDIVEKLMQAAGAYRHCLELQSDHAPSRRNLELVRQWIKYYNDKWLANDRQKRRDELDLMKFLEFIIETQTSLKETTKNIPERFTADGYAELKQIEVDLIEEIPYLKEKIEKELTPQQPEGAPGQTISDEEKKQLEEGIRLLQGWADDAKEKMDGASTALSRKDAAESVGDQEQAIEKLDQIWDAIVPFHPLLSKELAEQTAIAKGLNPESPKEEETADDPAVEPEQEPIANDQVENRSQGILTLSDEQLPKQLEAQEKTLRKSRMLAPKAEMELKQFEEQQANKPVPETPVEMPEEKTDDSEDENSAEEKQPPKVDPEEVKGGYRKAIELSPKAVEQMEIAVESLRKKDLTKAGLAAEEARRILQEIQDAQPKQPPQDQNQQNQDKNDQNQDQNKNEDQKDQDKDKQDQKDKDKKEEDQKDKEKKDDKDQDKKDDKQKQDEKKDENGNKQPQQISQDRIEEALRKVRERQQEKRDRDKKMRGKVYGNSPVDKDW